MANGRSSQDERKLEGGSPPAPQDNGLHPAFYIAYVTLVSGLNFSRKIDRVTIF